MAADIAEDFGERLAAEGEICWGGMHSWVTMVDLLERVGRPRPSHSGRHGTQTLLYLMGYNAPEHALLPEGFNWKDTEAFDEAYTKLTDELRPWTIDFHVAQNDGTVHGSGSQTRPVVTARPRTRTASWTSSSGRVLAPRRGRRSPAPALPAYLQGDGCMFPNSVMMNPQTWNDILETMINVRNAHGWRE